MDELATSELQSAVARCLELVAEAQKVDELEPTAVAAIVDLALHSRNVGITDSMPPSGPDRGDEVTQVGWRLPKNLRGDVR